MSEKSKCKKLVKVKCSENYRCISIYGDLCDFFIGNKCELESKPELKIKCSPQNIYLTK